MRPTDVPDSGNNERTVSFSYRTVFFFFFQVYSAIYFGWFSKSILIFIVEHVFLSRSISGQIQTRTLKVGVKMIVAFRLLLVLMLLPKYELLNCDFDLMIFMLFKTIDYLLGFNERIYKNLMRISISNWSFTVRFSNTGRIFHCAMTHARCQFLVRSRSFDESSRAQGKRAVDL